MRGKAKRSFNVPFHVGITPAHAGKSARVRILLCKEEDHPRPCGEKDLGRMVECGKQGSPPPMRGKARRASCVQAAAGITPAHAGKRSSLARLQVVIQDHPRPCGEKRKRKAKNHIFLGSPPPMRGKDIQNIGCIFEHRITPAHAGKSYGGTKSTKTIKDHPRPCGEKALYGGRAKRHLGSPPPMRGKATWPCI